MDIRLGMLFATIVLSACVSQPPPAPPVLHLAVAQPAQMPNDSQEAIRREQELARIRNAQLEAFNANITADACMKRSIEAELAREHPSADSAVGWGMLGCMDAWQKFDELQERADMLVRLAGGTAGPRGFRFEEREREEKRKAHYRQLAVAAISERKEPAVGRPTERVPPTATPRRWEERI